MRAKVFGALLLLAALGCDSQVSAPLDSACREFGARCALESGVVGICESRTCPAGERAPCFVCTPQH